MVKFVDLEDIPHPRAVLFGARLKESRKALKLTQTQLVGRTGITPGYLSEIENGRANPTLEMMVKLSDAVGVDVSILLIPADAGSKG
ncbi:helix-turn-helix domain-containing protein [Sphingomonas sp. BK481]|uniref:helix-turn-helix domain-containing protein n=1 Tax=Sphingomonas sp. BK481 TaxID=2586981 RepID=UPI00160C390B|nr:helix-turn-helix transcriptional regulator [Sphingomonas sp. BK481]MBB3588940.1 transcriptional regulator with XRE-family HTH domain [Sphingomonas sp. BK481]